VQKIINEMLESGKAPQTAKAIKEIIVAFYKFLPELGINSIDNIGKAIKIPKFDNSRVIELTDEKTSDNKYIINDLNSKNFILKDNNGIYTIVKLSNPSVSEGNSILLEEEHFEKDKDIKEMFAEYINNDWSIETKKIEKRIEYLDKILPEKLDLENPISIFEIFDIDKLKDITNTLKKGNSNYEWDRSKGGGGEIQQTLNQYIKFLEKLKEENNKSPINRVQSDTLLEGNNNVFESFIKKIEENKIVKIDPKWKNIEFIIGQPNTGKSYNFEESRLLNIAYRDYYLYKKIPVSGGIGNEYKGLQNTDLAITYDPIKEEVRFGEFLQILMSAIVNPDVPHVIFLDDFHNQDISSLLSEYTPLFKAQQMRSIEKVNREHLIFTKRNYESANEFINIWNDFIEKNCIDVPQVPLTNRISGESLKLVFPNNFYLFGAANFNQNSLNIFADWEDRAKIDYKEPIEDFIKSPEYNKIKDIPFVKCCVELNNQLKEVLEENNIFDNEKYCFGMWKLFDNEQKLIIDIKQQKEIIKFFFRMIKNSLRFNNKNSLINSIGKFLFIGMQTNDWFKDNIEEIKKELDDKEFYKILHTYNIYEDDI
jgi:hypothetical protein